MSGSESRSRGGDAEARVLRLETSMQLDGATIRDTLAYIRDDMRGVRGYERASEALALAIGEIEAMHPRREGPVKARAADEATWWPRWR